ncbi:MAG: protein O-mannosyl-transferase family, partial [Cyclobacteriaceae bacterium]
MKQYNFINNITGWLVFAVAAGVYLSTMEPTASFWDCGEFIASAYKLEVGHPPGAPFFMILGRFFSIFSSDPSMAAMMVNSLSALASAFTILFLFWTITHFARKILIKTNDDLTAGNKLAIFAAGAIGALGYTFSDTFWFSAVEGEVYASSSFFTAIVFWAILKWENVADEKHANRWLIFIAYMMGLSIGIHLLNLLAIPAIVFVYYFKKYTVSKKGIFATSIVSIVALSAIMWGVIPGLATMASKIELLFVNGLGLPINTGLFIYIILLLSVLTAGIYFTYKQKNNKLLISILSAALIFLVGAGSLFLSLFFATIVFLLVYYVAWNKHALLNTAMLGYAVVIIGYSSFAMIVIRSSANPPMDQNDPENMFSLLRYLNREQYGDRPLVYGEYFNAPVKEHVKKEHSYMRAGDQYVRTPKKTEAKYDSKFTTFFPRMYSNQQHHIPEYMKWTGMQEKELYKTQTNSQGKVEYDYSNPKRSPSFSDNLKFFFKYQIGHMYFRYFMWNFAGRQNDIQGFGEVQNGNWISGIKFIDEIRLGDQDKVSPVYANNAARNTYYFLPLILGLLGAFFQYKKHKKDFSIVTLLFFFTGIAIVIYLNQGPREPRERDYAYAGSFYAFSIWLGLGVLWIYNQLSKRLPSMASAGIALIVSLSVPAILAYENWDDHDRSNRYMARDFAHNYLESLEPNAIIFTNGDNDTFPLWYAQEVEGIRTDVRVVNLSYLSADWYINQMHRKAYDSKPLPISMTPEKYIQGTRDVVFLTDILNKPMDLDKAIMFISSDKEQTKHRSQSGELVDYLPTRSLRLPVDKEKVLKNGTVEQKLANRIVPYIEWKINKSYIIKSELILLDILANNNWERPVYFAITVSPENFMNLSDYFQLSGLAYKLVPVKSNDRQNGIGEMNTDVQYEKMMNTFKWGGLENPGIYLDETIRRMLFNMRGNFSRLATSLIEEGKKDSALAVLNRAEELIPHEKLPYNYYNIAMVRDYFELGKKAKAI